VNSRISLTDRAAEGVSSTLRQLIRSLHANSGDLSGAADNIATDRALMNNQQEGDRQVVPWIELL
jgi:hypothetical protein